MTQKLTLDQFNPYQTGEQSVGGTLSPGELAKRAERERCVQWLDIAIKLGVAEAARLRKAGTFRGQSLHITWPFVRSVDIVHHNWERAAQDRDAFARRLVMIRQALSEGWQPKELDDVDAG